MALHVCTKLYRNWPEGILGHLCFPQVFHFQGSVPDHPHSFPASLLPSAWQAERQLSTHGSLHSSASKVQILSFCPEFFPPITQLPEEFYWIPIWSPHLIKFSLYKVFNHLLISNHQNCSTNINCFLSLPLVNFLILSYKINLRWSTKEKEP